MNKGAVRRNEELSDFTTTRRVLPISLLAMGIGVVCAFVALALLRLIGFFTHVFYYGNTGTSMISPAGNHLGYWSVLVPVARRNYCGDHGAIRIGAYPRPRNSRSD